MAGTAAVVITYNSEDVIEACVAGLREFAPEVRVLVLRIGAPHDVEVVTDWTDAIDFEAPEIEANGTTPLGAGVRYALQEIEAEKEREKKKA